MNYYIISIQGRNEIFKQGNLLDVEEFFEALVHEFLETLRSEK